MRFLMNTVYNEAFTSSEIADLSSKFKSFNMETEFQSEIYGNKLYSAFVCISSIDELNKFVHECGHQIVYGRYAKVNGKSYNVIEIYDTFRE